MNPNLQKVDEVEGGTFWNGLCPAAECAANRAGGGVSCWLSGTHDGVNLMTGPHP